MLDTRPTTGASMPPPLVRGRDYVPARLAGWRPLDLTPRDAHILHLLGNGLAYAAVARRLGIAQSTVTSAAKRLCAEVGVVDAVDLLALTRRAEWPQHLPPFAPTTIQRSEGLWLTLREADVIRHLAKGKTYQGIAESLGISYATVRHHLRSIYKKFGAHNSHGVLGAIVISGWPRIRTSESRAVRLYLPPS